jgi:hypothetical protein
MSHQKFLDLKSIVFLRLIVFLVKAFLEYDPPYGQAAERTPHAHTHTQTQEKHAILRNSLMWGVHTQGQTQPP